LPGRPGSAEFMQAYAACLAASENAIAHIGASRIAPGSLDAARAQYLASDAFTKKLGETTQTRRRRILDDFCNLTTPKGGYRYGANRLATIAPQNVRDAIAGKPVATARDWLKALRHFAKYCVGAKLIARNFVTGIETERAEKSSGYAPW